MGSEDDDNDVPAWGGLIQTALDEAGDEEDEEGINVVSNSPISGGTGGEDGAKELPYVVLLNAAVSMIKSGELSDDEFVEGVKKLDVIADNALKVYAIPAVKKDLPGKLTDYQNEIVNSLEVQLHRLKEGLGLLLGYPETRSIDDLETGLKIAVKALNDSAEIQRKADAEKADIMEREQQEKARRAQRAAGVEEDDADESED